MDPDRALQALLGRLDAEGYRFVTPTPETHRRVVRRADRQVGRSLRDVFGWSLPFTDQVLDPDLAQLMEQAGVLERRGGFLRSTVRASTVHERLFLHSAFPTDAPDSVFLGPDSYRFADLVRSELVGRPSPREVVDIGAGAGVGAVTAAASSPGARLILTDVNLQALRLARINAAHAGLAVETIETNGLEGLDGPFDLILANPPYILDPQGPAYRDGGDMHGGRLSLDWARAAMARLAPGGMLILYTGSAIVDGRDGLGEALEAAAGEAGCGLRYREIDPDVFGEQLELEPYQDVERIAVVAAVASRPVRPSR